MRYSQKKHASELQASGGYSQTIIGGIYYTGYDAYLKYFIPFKSSNWFYGIGVRYDSTSSTTQQGSEQNTFAYKSAQAGIDLAYKLSYSFIDLELNPYVYCAFYNLWTRNTMTSGITITDNSPVKNNIVYGMGASLLFNVGNFYFGPSAYYSQGYMACDSYTDNNGNFINTNKGYYASYNFNLTEETNL
jgi:hypothetical protein